MRTPCWTFLLLVACAVTVSLCTAQQPTHPDAFALLEKAAQSYAETPKSFHLESTEIQSNWNRYQHSTFTTEQSILSAPNGAYRITTMSGMGSSLRISDGKTVHALQIESNVYVEHPTTGSDAPKTPDFFDGVDSPKQIISYLHTTVSQFRSAHYIGEETLTLKSHRFPCYIIRVGKKDVKSSNTKYPQYYSTYTFWIDKQSFVFRKIVDIQHSAFMQGPDVHVPFDGRTETTYPVVDFAPRIDPASFTFTPPPGARLVPALAQTSSGGPKTILIGKPAPDVTLISATQHTALSSLRGKPILIDFWATWCGPCTAAMPAMATLQHDFTAHGGLFLTINQDNTPEDATDYLKQHHYDWQDFHDTDSKLSTPFHIEGIPDVLLIDSSGKVVYDYVGSDEPSLRRAIAKLGPEFQALAPPPPKSCNCSTTTTAASNQNPGTPQ
jgi:cytochrome c biogenesis protein CcmG, thiol:disulfide interchange protein DsbE